MINATNQHHGHVSPGIPRIGLIGVTGYGASYVESLTKLVEEGRIQWAAVTIINPEEAKAQMDYFEKLGVPIYSDYLEMLDVEEPNLDLVCIPTGIGWHSQMTVACLLRGLQVLVEKPLAPTLQDVEAIQAVEEETSIKVGVGFQHLYPDETWEIKKRLLDGEIGKLQRVDCIALWPRALSYYNRNDWSGHLHNGDGWILDSPLHNALSHLINMILFWSGETLDSRADLLSVSAELYRSKPILSFDTLRTVAALSSDVEAAVVLSHSSLNSIDPEIVITGSKGSFTWRFCGSHSFDVDGNRSEISSPDQVSIREIMFHAMTDKVQGKPARLCTTEMAKGVCKWVNAVHDAGAIMDVPDAFCARIVGRDGETYDTIKDLEYQAMRSFRECLSFFEAGAAWAGQASTLDVSNYEHFEGRFYPQPRPPIPDPEPQLP